MAFLVEDGTGVVGAVSYASVAAYRAYCASAGIDLTGVSDTTIEGHLASATAFIEQLRWNGSPKWTDNQRRLGIPRNSFDVWGNSQFADGTVFGASEVPWVIPHAVILLAQIERSSGEGLNTPRDASKLVVEKSIGPAGISKRFAIDLDDPQAAVGQRSYPIPMGLLRGLYQANKGGMTQVAVVI